MSRRHHIPVADATVPSNPSRLSDAMSKLKLERKGLGTDITHGTEFYCPIITLLARTIGTRRVDLVLKTWPILGAPFFAFESKLPKDYAARLTERMLQAAAATGGQKGSPSGVAVLHQIIDLLQSVGKWELSELVRWVRDVEGELRRQPEMMTMLEAAADEAVRRHDAEGVLTNAPQLSEGFVIPVDGPGRVN